MSFLQQLEGETPALTLEETLAFLDSFDDSDFASGDSASSTSSPPYEGDCDDDDLDDLLLSGGAGGKKSTATTTTGGSERSWSESNDGHGRMTSPPRDVASPAFAGGVTPQTKPMAPPQPKPRQKRKAAASTNASPRGGVSPDDADAFDDAESTTAAAAGKRRTRKQPKTEILRLRDQVEELHARLMQLQKAGGGPSDKLASAQSNNARATGMLHSTDKASVLSVRAPNPQSASLWLDHAVDQYKALQKSEVLNEKLKAEVKRQSTLGKMLKTLFKKKTAQQVCRGGLGDEIFLFTILQENLSA